MAVLLSLGIPPGAVPADGGFPLGWLTSRLAQSPGWAWGAKPLPLPSSPTGDGAGRGGYADAARTRASGGAGETQRLVDGLPGLTGRAVVQRTTTPVTVGRFDPETSERDPAASRSRTTVYVNEDGSRTSELTTVPTNYRADDGSWRPIDPTLVRRDGRWVAKESPLGVSLATDSSAARASVAADPLVALSLPDGNSVRWGLAGAAAVDAVVDGTTATYPAVLPGTDLEVVARPDGVKETLVLASPAAGSEWVFPLALHKLSARSGADGAIELVDRAGAVAAAIPPAFMRDSSVDAATGRAAQSSAVTMELVQLDDGPAIKMVADRAWLTDPARVFPVRVDPTVTAGPDDDVFVDSDPDTDATVQNGDHLQVGVDEDGVTSRTFLNFDISSALTDPTPTIDAARVKLFLLHQPSCDTGATLSVSAVEQRWTASELATVSYPGPDIDAGTYTQSYDVPASVCANTGADPANGHWVTFTAYSLVEGWALGGQNFGLALTTDEDDPAQRAVFASADYGSGQYAPQLVLDLTADVPPQVDVRYPGPGAVVSTLTPELLVVGHDPDVVGLLGFAIWVYDADGKVVYDRASSESFTSRSTASFPIPSGMLEWNRTYSWSVVPFGGNIFGARYPKYPFHTRVPQPALGSRLVQNPGVGYNPEIGNYTTSVTDAQVAGVGPALEITRSYNSLDTRRSGAFGAGWSSLLDARVTSLVDASDEWMGASVRYPDGSVAAFGLDADESFTAPPGRDEVLAGIVGDGLFFGYELRNKQGTTYTFDRRESGGVFRLTSVTDANGQRLTLTYDADGRVAKLTNASGRSMTVTWQATASPSAGAHVTSVTTDAPTAGGSGHTWTYTYASDDRLTGMCPPTPSCRYYQWDNSANQGANAVLNQAPSSYWRLNEPSGSTWAASSVLDNGGTDVAFYEDTTTGGSLSSAWPGSASTATSFNGTSSRVRLPSEVAADGAYQSISLWFSTTATDGVLFSYQSDPITAGSTTGKYTPVMYVDTDGRLRAKFRAEPGAATMVTSEAVDDGDWHHVVLAGAGDSQALYLDGARVAGSDGVINMYAYGGAAYRYVGAGFIGGDWPGQPDGTGGGDPAQASFFDGQVADVAVFDRPLTASDVGDMYRTAVGTSRQLSRVTSAYGRQLTELSMNAVTGRLSSMVDGNGGTWTMGTPRVSGSSALYAASVLGSVPSDYWRLRDAAGVDAVNEAWGGTATYSAVTLGVAGPFADGSAASFDGSSSVVSVPGARVAPTGASTQELWFRTTGTGQVLMGTQNAALDAAPSTGLPVLWIDDRGRLRAASPSTTPTAPLTSGIAGKCAEIKDGASADDTPVVIGTCDGTPKQSWRYFPDQQQLRQFGKCLDVYDTGTTNGTVVQLYSCHSGPAQKWVPHHGGWRNPHSGKCLDDPNSSTSDGTQLVIWTCRTHQLNQQWTLSLGSAQAVNDGRWHHAVLTTNGLSGDNITTQTLYLDGEQVQSSTGQPLTPGPQPHGYLGAGHTGTGWSTLPAGSMAYYTGSLAEVAVYGRQLSAAEVALHHDSVGGTAPLVVTASGGGSASGGASALPLAQTAAGSLPAQALAPGTAAVDAAGLAEGTTTVSNPVKIVSVTDPGGNQVSYSYDLMTGRKSAQTDAVGHTTLYGYDTGGFTSLVYDPNGIVTRTVQDERGNTIQQVTCQDQAAEKCSSSYYSYYWNDGDVTDPRNGRMLASRGPGSDSATDDTYLTSYTYDAAGNLLSTTDPVGRTTTISYTDGTSVAAVDDGLAPAGLPWKVLDPSGGLRTIRYTAAGDVAESVDAAGAVTTFGYDRLGRETSRTVVTASFPEGRTTSTTYDPVDRVVTVTEPPVTNRVTGAVHTRQTWNGYGMDGFLVRQEVRDLTGGDATRATAATFGPYGKRVEQVDPQGNATAYGYDSYGHLVSQTDPDGVVSVYDVDPNGNLLSRTVVDYRGDPNDPQDPVDLVVESNTYDPGGRLASTTDAMGYITSYTYTDDGRTASVTRSDGTASFVLESNSYDAAGNLIEQRRDNGLTTTAYRYDAAGRQDRSTLDPGGLNRITDLTLSPGDQVLSSQSRRGSGGALEITDYAYDVQGRQVSQTRFRSDRVTTPVARWPLDETDGTVAADAAGNSPGTTTGVTWEPDAERGQVAVFDGESARITTAASVVDTTRPYTVAAWLRVDDTGGDGTVLEVPGSAGDQPAFRLYYDAAVGGWRARVAERTADGSVATYSRAFGVGGVQAGAWQHVAVGVNPAAGLWTIFLDGVKISSYGGAGHHSVASGGLSIGGSAQGMFHGAISDLRVYQQVSYDEDWAAGVADGTVPADGAGVSRTSYVLDDGGLAVEVVDPRGNSTYVDHDAADRPVLTAGPPVRAEVGDGSAAVTARPVAKIGYNTFGEVVEESDENGAVTTYRVDANGRPEEVVLPTYTPPGGADPVAPAESVVYDSLGQVLSRTDALGRVTTVTYDQLGRPVRQVMPDGATTTAGYDLAGNLLSVIDPTGAQTGSTYDMLGRVTSVSATVRQTGQVHTSTLAYDPAGRVASETSADGVSTHYGYNAAGQVNSVVDGAGQTTRTEYDGLGRPVKQINPDGTYSVTSYDMLSQPVTTAEYSAAGGPALATSTWTYDAAGATVSATDARGSTVRFSYDATGLLRSQSQPVDADVSIDTSFGYDLAGNQTRFTDGRGNAFGTTYNPWGLPQSQIEPATAAYPDAADRTYTMVYDAAGQLVGQHLPGGVTRSFAYDQAGRLTGQSGSGAQADTAERSFGYDAAGRMTSFTGVGGTNTIGYDDRGLPLEVAGPSGDSEFTYTGDGLLASRSDPAGLTAYGYDGAGRLASLSNADAGIAVGYTYDAMSAVSSMAYGGSGNRRVFAYDERHRLISDTLVSAGGAEVASVGYGWDANGNETSKTVTRAGSTVTNTYTYDRADRLTSWDDGTTAVGYRYDAAGNRIGVGDVDYVYDQRNRLVSDSAGATYQYTARGGRSSVTTGGSTVTTVTDAFDQVVSRQPAGGGVQTYAYDGLGRLARDGFAYAGLDNDLAVDDTAAYVRDPDGVLAGVRAGTGAGRLVWTDLHDDVIAQLDDTGATVTGTSTYTPLGEVVTTTGVVGNLGYQSEWTDPATGHVNMHARWYDPATGQFDTRDSVTVSPVPDPVRANRYQYGDANPLTVTDPTGHFGKRFRKAFNKVTKTVTKTWNKATSAVKNTWNTVTEGINNLVDQAVNGIHDLANRAAEAVQQARDQLAEKVNDLKQSMSQAFKQLEQAGQMIKSAAQRAADRVGQWAMAARDWVVEHQADIVGALVGMVVEAACMVAVGWTGVGAVACGVAAGAIGGVVTGAMQGHRGLDLLQDAAIGGLAGGIGAAMPMMGSAASRALGKAAGGIGKTAAGKAAGRAGAAVRSLGKPAGKATSRGTSRGSREVAEHVDDAARAGGGRADDVADAARGCTRHSFAPDTRVRMADGTSTSISEVELDDEVLATDPVTGTTTARPVRVLYRNDDRDLVDVTVTDTVTGDSTVVHTTAHHPFWNADSDRWTDAADLRPGDRLYDVDGAGTQQVSDVEVYVGQALMNDLTVAGVHTYYVLAEDTPVLVHNCGGQNPAHPAACSCGRDAANNIVWPPNKGFQGGSRSTILKKGTRINRYGSEDGRYVSPVDVLFEQRALPIEKRFGVFHEYVVLRDTIVEAGTAAPWFGQAGGGTQYFLSRKAHDLVRLGVLEEVTADAVAMNRRKAASELYALIS
ncbi:LamG-like jellyroll fold domain-containing protein [Solwaraspora sp. WMMB335]|uniref:LamG-like jellyroll fold domain-containing protein n=1 Tax=Solwaraspora sp. WMMB335 TaxID=3404118 RepID=UPI003B923EF4